MTDLETAIRDALRERAESVPIRHATLLARRRRWVAPALAAAVVVAVVVITLVVIQRTATKPSVPTGSPRNTSAYVGHRWKLVAIDDGLGHLVVAHKSDAMVSFGRDGSFAANDTVNSYSGKYHVHETGYSLGAIAGTAAGFAGSPRSVTGRIIAALSVALGDDSRAQQSAGHVVPARVRAGVLHIGDGLERATFIRAGPASGH